MSSIKMNYLTIAFDQIHEGMGMLRRGCEGTEDREVINAIGALDIAIFKPLRALRLKLGVPYYEEEVTG